MADYDKYQFDPQATFLGRFQQAEERNRLLAQQQAQQERANKLADIQLRGAQRGEEEALMEREAYKNQDPLAALRAAGLGKQAAAYEKQQQDRRTAQINQAKDALTLMKSSATSIFANPDPVAAKQQLLRFQQLTGQDVSSDLATLESYGNDPAKIKQWAAGYAIEADKLLPKFETRDVGGAVQRQGYDPLTGAPLGAAQTTRKTATPGEVMTDARARAQMAQSERQFQTQQTGGRDIVANTLTDAAGNVTQYNKFGEQIGGTKQGVGKPSATFEKTKAAKQELSRNISQVIPELEAITKEGGLIDQSTGSGLGRLADISAGFVGQATPGAIAIGKLKPVADLVLKMIPRFEGPQSDKDTQSYKEAAGQLADPAMPTKIRKAAALEVLRLMKARKDQFATSDMVEPAAAPSNIDALLNKYK